MNFSLCLLLFSQAGPLTSVKIPKTHQGESKAYAFIEYQHECSVDYAIQLFHRTTLYGQELHLKHRKKNDTGHPGPARTIEMQRTSSLPIIMPNQYVPINMHFQPPMQFLRPQLMPGHMIPLMNPMLNHVIGMPVPPIVPHHIRFNEEGLPRSESIPIPAVANGRYQDHGANSSNHNIMNKRRFDNEDGNNSRHDFQHQEKKKRYSHSAKHESYEDKTGRRYSHGNEHRHIASHPYDADFRSGRRESDNRSNRTDVDSVNDRRHRGDHHRPSRSYNEDDHYESRSHYRERSHNRPYNPRHYNDK